MIKLIKYFFIALIQPNSIFLIMDKKLKKRTIRFKNGSVIEVIYPYCGSIKSNGSRRSISFKQDDFDKVLEPFIRQGGLK